MIFRRNYLVCSRLVAVVLVGLLVTGCRTSAPPEVIDVNDPSPPSASSLEMVQALGQLNNLEEELKLLRNAIEEVQFQQENADRRQQDQYQDIDRRLLALEENIASFQEVPDQRPLTPSEQVLAEGETGGGVPALDPRSESSDGDPDAVASLPSDNTTTRSVGGSSDGSSTGSVSLNEQQAYDNAFESLKQSRYDDAIAEFGALVNTWPDSQLADDALFWMSEANYVNREFEEALNGFRRLVRDYPDSSRLPEAMLKVGYIQYDIGAYDEAAQTFQDILSRFPGHQVTVSAETRLRRIQQTIQ